MRVNGSMYRGDTIIEVMLAITVFAMLAVGVLTLMNRGVASAQDALETTLVRQQIDGQAEVLRFLHQAYMLNPDAATGSARVFKDIRDNRAVNSASKFGTDGSDLAEGSCIKGIPSKGFALNPDTASIIEPMNVKAMGTVDISAPAFAQVVGSYTPAIAYGLWIEAVEGDNHTGTASFYDFHIRACWDAVSSNIPHTLGTIVRLYVP
jgi:type II secretory pathway pseudopilin PulG